MLATILGDDSAVADRARLRRHTATRLPLFRPHTTSPPLELKPQSALFQPLDRRPARQEYGERVRVCVTVTRAEDLQLLRPLLPPRPAADIRLLPPDSRRDVALFLSDARPAAGVLFESPVHPATVLAAAAARVPLALLSASIPGHDLISWNGEPAARRVLERVLACFSLIVPQTDADTARLRILGATLEQMPGWCGDLRYAAAVGPGVYGGAASWRPATAQAARKLVAGRQAWLAAMTVAGEEAAVARVHCAVTRACSSAKAAAAVAAGGRSSGTGSSDTAPPPTPTTPLLTLIAPDDSSRCTDVLQALQAAGLTAELWSAACQRLLMSPDSPQQQQQGQQQEKGTEQLGASTPGAACSPSSLDAATAAGHAPPPPAATAVPSPPLSCDVVDVIVVDDLGALSALYSEVEIALLGNSLLPGENCTVGL